LTSLMQIWGDGFYTNGKKDARRAIEIASRTKPAEVIWIRATTA